MADDRVDRRSLLDTAIKAGLVVYVGGMAVPAAIYLLPAHSSGPTEGLVAAGRVDDFPAGTARLVQGAGRPIIVLSLAGGRFRAFSAICTHLGCVVKWDAAEGRIACPCHAGYFGTDGKVLSGPPPRALPEYEVVRVGDELKVRL